MAKKQMSTASKKVERPMKERKEGTLHSGKSGKKVTSRKQAIAIGLSEARKKGAKVPKKAKKVTKKSSATTKAAKKTAKKVPKKARKSGSLALKSLMHIFGAKG